MSGFTGCTVASPAFHAHARVLAESFGEHHPDGRFAIVDLARAGAGAGAPLEIDDERVEVLAPDEVIAEPGELDRLGMAYSTQGLAGALKVRLLRHLVDREARPAMLIDSDICVFGALDDLADRAAAESALVTTHLLTPHPGAEPPTLLAGAFNSGFVVVGPHDRELLDWWERRTARECIFRPATGMVWEQSWLALAPAFFEIDVLRDRGVNAMTRELLDHDIEWTADGPRLAGRPLRAFHFSGPYDPHRPGRLLSQAPEGEDVVNAAGPGAVRAELAWLSLERKPGARRMSEEYAERLLAAGFDESRRSPPPYLRAPEGGQVTAPMRCAYRDALVEAERSGAEHPPNPFAGCSWPEFVDWLAEPAGREAAEAGLTRFALAFWQAQGVGAAFPDVVGADAEAYLGWLADRLERDPQGVPARLRPRSGRRRPRVRRGMLRR